MAVLLGCCIYMIVSQAIESESFRYTGSKLAHYLALPGQVPFDFTKFFFEW